MVFPTRDRWDLLRRTLPTALNQEAVDLEVVLVDDGSRDDGAGSSGADLLRAAKALLGDRATTRAVEHELTLSNPQLPAVPLLGGGLTAAAAVEGRAGPGIGPAAAAVAKGSSGIASGKPTSERVQRLGKKIFRGPAAFAIHLAARASKRRVGIALVYHAVGESDGPAARYLVPPLAPRRLHEQVQHLKRRYQLVPASELLSAARTRKRGERFPVAITFDDDLRTHMTVAAPILTSLDVPSATFFLTGASLSEPFTFWWERLQRAIDEGIDLEPLLPPSMRAVPDSPSADPQPPAIRRLAEEIRRLAPEERDVVARKLLAQLGSEPEDAGLREADVRSLVAQGFDVGFHTLRHDSLPPLDDEGLHRAMTNGRQQLAAVVGKRLSMIAYPHGRANRRVARAAAAAGYAVGFTTEQAAIASATDPLLMGRLEPCDASRGQFALWLARAIRAGADERPASGQAQEPIPIVPTAYLREPDCRA